MLTSSSTVTYLSKVTLPTYTPAMLVSSSCFSIVSLLVILAKCDSYFFVFHNNICHHLIKYGARNIHCL
jgi:hypothetical protein